MRKEGGAEVGQHYSIDRSGPTNLVGRARWLYAHTPSNGLYLAYGCGAIGTHPVADVRRHRHHSTDGDPVLHAHRLADDECFHHR